MMTKAGDEPVRVNSLAHEPSASELDDDDREAGERFER